jgi:hypothetical protein
MNEYKKDQVGLDLDWVLALQSEKAKPQGSIAMCGTRVVHSRVKRVHIIILFERRESVLQHLRE